MPTIEKLKEVERIQRSMDEIRNQEIDAWVLSHPTAYVSGANMPAGKACRLWKERITRGSAKLLRRKKGVR